MIIVENRLIEAFDMLPEIGGIKPTYRWGNEEHLLKLLELFSKSNATPYPLIYQVTNEDEPNNVNTEVDLKLILAVRNIDTALLNENRWAMTYKDVLFPLAQNIITVFNKSGIFLWNGQYKLYKFPNYGNGKENFTTDIWDALRIDTNIKITTYCKTKYIKF